MNSKQVKQAFKDSGIRVRVADLGLKFRICPLSDADGGFADGKASAVAAALGLTSILRELGGQLNGARELIGYKPGAVVICK